MQKTIGRGSLWLVLATVVACSSPAPSQGGAGGATGKGGAGGAGGTSVGGTGGSVSNPGSGGSGESPYGNHPPRSVHLRLPLRIKP